MKICHQTGGVLDSTNASYYYMNDISARRKSVLKQDALH